MAGGKGHINGQTGGVQAMHKDDLTEWPRSLGEQADTVEQARREEMARKVADCLKFRSRDDLAEVLWAENHLSSQQWWCLGMRS